MKCDIKTSDRQDSMHKIEIYFQCKFKTKEAFPSAGVAIKYKKTERRKKHLDTGNIMAA